MEYADFWEEHYAASASVWSGKVNYTLEQAVAPLAPGRSLDLGCGEGGDVHWLASRGWQATGVDISATAIARAAGQGPGRFLAADLAAWHTDERFDLVTMGFFQAPFEFGRARLLRKAASLVAPGGHLLLISHAAAPPWAGRRSHGPGFFPQPGTELEALQLDESWQVLRAEVASRPATAPDGSPATLDDTVVFARRGGSAAS